MPTHYAYYYISIFDAGLFVFAGLFVGIIYIGPIGGSSTFTGIFLPHFYIANYGPIQPPSMLLNQIKPHINIPP